MQIEKIVRVQNVGRLKNLTSKGDVAFRRLNLLYGPNAHGKTTVAGILRSLKTGERAYIDERRTLGAVGEPGVELRLTGVSATFKSGVWTHTLPELEIFDGTFISENVYTGDAVDSEHRRNLYQVLVGDAAVQMAKRIDDVDGETRALSREATAIEEELRKSIQAPFDTDDFLGLSQESDLEAKIRDTTTRLNAARKSKDVLSRRELETLSKPLIPKKAFEVLAVTAKKISGDAEAIVRKHIQSRLDARGEQWLRQGAEYLSKAEDHCPFCAQSTVGVDVVVAYGAYFSTAYRDHVVAIERAMNELTQQLGDQALGVIQRRALENDGRIEAWSDLVSLGYAKSSLDEFSQALANVRRLLGDALKEKLANPSVAATVGTALEAAVKDFEDAVAKLDTANEAIARANEAIAKIKKEAATTTEEALEKELRRLRNIQIRAEPAVAAQCDALREKWDAKKKLEAEKKEGKKKLEAVAESVLAKYEKSINLYLANFGANFRIVGTKPNFAGGKASSTYQISINNVALDLGDSRTPRGTPCFRTALSAGDKSTLALAFFLARLEHDPGIGSKVVVFDDPLSSLDCFRQACTQQQIRNIASKAAQVFVLSHEPMFLQHVFESAEKASMKTVYIVRDGADYVLREWDVVKYCGEAAQKDYFVLRSYLEDGPPDGGDLLPVGRAIRPYLEGHLRNTFPGEFPSGKWLGDFIQKIRDSGGASPFAGISDKLAELEAVNGYSAPFHHSGPAPAVDDTELRAYAQRAVTFVQG